MDSNREVMYALAQVLNNQRDLAIALRDHIKGKKRYAVLTQVEKRSKQAADDLVKMLEDAVRETVGK